MQQTHTHWHALVHSFICTFTIFHDSSFMHGPVLLHSPSLSSVEESGMALREDAARPVGTLRGSEVEAGGSGTQIVPWLWAHGLVTEPFMISAPFDLWQAGDRAYSILVISDCCAVVSWAFCVSESTVIPRRKTIWPPREGQKMCNIFFKTFFMVILHQLFLSPNSAEYNAEIHINK